MSQLDPVEGKPGGHGTVNTAGYKTFWRDGQNRYEHRLVWEKLFGPIPKGMVLHHKDENRLNNELSNLELIDIRTHRRIHSKNYKLIDGEWRKQCIECLEILSLNDFYPVRYKHNRNGKSYDTFNSRCKPCARAAARVK